MNNGRDFISLLPEEVSSYILSCLDGETLLACASVSESWNQKTNRLHPRIFIEACWEAGFSISEDKYRDAAEWKAFLSSMLRRLRAIKACTCYRTFTITIHAPVTAFYCHNEKIAMGFRGKVEILNTTNTNYYVEFGCGFEPSLLKFDDNMLVAASRTGYISSWCTTSKNHLRNYIHPNTTLLSFDFLTDYSLLVSSNINQFCSNIYVWSTAARNRKENARRIEMSEKIIYTVILAPTPYFRFNNQKESCFLFALSDGCVLVWIVETVGRLVYPMNSFSFGIPPSPRILRDVNDLTSSGVLFDGHEMYFTVPSPQGSRSVWAWNIRGNTERHLRSYGPILNLLGVGEKYLVYNVRYPDFDAVVAVDKKSNEHITSLETPRITNGVYVCLGHTSWLDGLNGENDSGIVYASIMNAVSRVIFVKFAPRSE